MEISDRSQRGLWVSGDDQSNPTRGVAERGEAIQQLPDGSQCSGRYYNIAERATGFNPKKFYGFTPNSANDWLLVGYTPSGVEKLMEEDRERLMELGFLLNRNLHLRGRRAKRMMMTTPTMTTPKTRKKRSLMTLILTSTMSCRRTSTRIVTMRSPEENTEPMDAVC